jgi:SMC interacting uncharacterized protein involved in chromosome segregation
VIFAESGEAGQQGENQVSDHTLSGFAAFERVLGALVHQVEEKGEIDAVREQQSTKIVTLLREVEALTRDHERMQAERDKARSELLATKVLLERSVPALRDLVHAADSARDVLGRHGEGSRVFRSETNNEGLCLADAINKATAAIDQLDADHIPS